MYKTGNDLQKNNTLFLNLTRHMCCHEKTALQCESLYEQKHLREVCQNCCQTHSDNQCCQHYLLGNIFRWRRWRLDLTS